MERSIIKFVLLFPNGVRIRYPVSELQKITPHLFSVSRIIFIFAWIIGYPYGNHTITMERKPYGFEIQFYYLYNASNQRVDFSMTEKIQDFNVLIELLYTNEELRNTLLPYTADPFHKSLVPL